MPGAGAEKGDGFWVMGFKFLVSGGRQVVFPSTHTQHPCFSPGTRHPTPGTLLMSRPAVIVMCKAPRAGAAKTRLAPSLTGAGAAELAACFFVDVCAAAGAAAAELVVAYAPADGRAELEALLRARGRGMGGGRVRWFEQRGRDLGGRLTSAVARAFQEGLGPVAAVWIALYSGIAGGLMGLVVAGCSGYLAQALTNVWSLLMYWRIVGLKPAPELTLSTHQGPRLAYAVPVFAGLMVTIWLQ